MVRRLWALVLCALLCVSMAMPARAEGVKIEPTRNPNVTAFDINNPEQLQRGHIVAHSFILIERSTGQILMEHDADLAMYPASTIKILTCLMAIQLGNLDDVLTISASALDPANLPGEDPSMAGFKVGEEVTLRDALYGLMLPSGNDAANAIAEHLAGNIPAFALWMNEVATMLGCTNSYFMSANGMDIDGQYSSAHDLAIIFDEALKNETFRQIISTPEYTLSATNKNPSRLIYNTNQHIRPDNADRFYAPSLGGKTGSTNQAAYCLVEAAEQDGVELIAVVLCANYYSRWTDVSYLFRYGFSQYKSITPESVYMDAVPPPTVQVVGFDPSDPDLGRLPVTIAPVDPTREVRITALASEIDAIIDNFSAYSVETWTNLRAPIQQGQVVGTLTFYPDNEPPAVYNLLAARSIAARTDAPLTLEEIEARAMADPSPFPPFALDWVLPPVLLALAMMTALRYAIRALWRRHKKKKELPEPKRRYYM
ncbi:MAG: D-alanyl-D-alanine carboxypeptidase [Oscillospiraceae bacterium]|jgi:D-alanyl-D-alanine carboxypeptidase|nr:D-alanyl-D-alanine carboxypeptidase [Oscillospiraceae bacterium]